MDDPVTRDGLRSWLTQVRDGEMGADARVLASVGLDFAGEVDVWMREHDAKLAALRRTIDERDAARAELARCRDALTRLVGPSVIFAGWTPCALESGNCFWCGANQHLDAPHAADCALEGALAALAATKPEEQ